MQKVMTFLLLHLAYMVGIGITSIVGKLLKRSFFPMRPVKSNWVKHKTSGPIKTMY